MKKAYVTIFSFLMVLASFSQSYVQVGSGEVSTTFPVYGVWGYSWHSAIYPAQNDMVNNDITHIALSCNNGPRTASNQKIYMKLATEDVFADASYESPETNGYTLVFEGNITFEGWTMIDITDFSYDGTSNIIVHWESRNGSFNYQYPNFNSTTSVTNNNKGVGGDVGFPTSNGWLNPYPSSLPNIRFYYQAGAEVPETPQNEFPQNNASKVEVDGNLSIDLGENTSAYDVYLSTDETLVTAMDVSALVASDLEVTAPGTYSYTLTENLQSKTQYFWRVVAKNTDEQTPSPVFAFETQRVISNLPYTQGFEDEEIWTPGWYGDLSLTDWFYTSSPMSWNKSSELNGYEGNHSAVCNPSGTGGEFILMTPRINLTNNHHVAFWWRNNDPVINGSKLAGTDATHVEISTDGAQTWSELGVLSPEQPTEWSWVFYELSDYAGDNVYIRWRYVREENQEGTPIFIDGISIDQNSDESEINLSHNTVDFPELAAGGIYGITLTVSNTATSVLNINSVETEGPFSCDFNASIQPGESQQVTIYFEPTSAGNHSGTATFQIDGNFVGNNVVALSGTAASVISEFFQGFDASLDLPSGWNAINHPEHDYTAVNVVADAYGAYSAPNAAKFVMFTEHNYPVTLITPGVDGFETNKLRFYAKKGDATYDVSLIVGVMENPYDASSFEVVSTIELTDGHQEFEVVIPASNTKPYIGFRHSQNPETNSVTSIWLDDITWNAEGNNPPEAALLVAPEDNATDVDILSGVDLVWANAGGNPEGYKLFLGTNPEADNMIDGEMLQGDNNTSYHITSDQLEYSQIYYWKVIPYNENGDATDITVWSFISMDNPLITEFPFYENFDEVENVSGFTYPLGWSVENANDDNLCWDILSNSDYSPENAFTAPNAMHVAFHPYNAKDDYLFTPPMDLQADKQYSVSFMMQTLEDAVTGTVYTEKIKVFLGNDSSSEAMSFEILDFQVDKLGWEEVTAAFNVPEDGEYYLAFYAYSEPDQYLLIIDDVKVDIVESYAVNFTAGENGSLEAFVDNMPINSGDEVYHGAEVMFTATPDEGYRIREWVVNGEPVADFIEETYTVSNIYSQLEVNVEFELATSIDEPSDTGLSAFPNPFNNSITYSRPADVKYVVFTNSLGKEVKSLTPENSGVISTDDLAEGFYIVVFYTNDGRQIIKKMMKRE